MMKKVKNKKEDMPMHKDKERKRMEKEMNEKEMMRKLFKGK